MNKITDKLFLGIDCGTQSLKICCVDEKGNVVASAKRKLKTYYRGEFWAEQNPNDWWKALVACAQTICKNKSIARRIVAIGVCGTCSTIVPCNSKIQPKDLAILWMDNRANKEAEELRQTLKRAGLSRNISSEQTAPKLLWLARNYPDSLKGLLVECVSWLVFQLTGKLSVSDSITRFTRGVSFEEWNKLGKIYSEVREGLRALDILEKPTTSVAGILKSKIAAELGIISRHKIIVAVGGNDGLISAVGAGLLSKTPSAIETGGTSYVLAYRTKKIAKSGDTSIENPFETNTRILISSIESAGLFMTKLIDTLNIRTQELETLTKKAIQEIRRGTYRASSLKINVNLLGDKMQIKKQTAGSIENIKPITKRKDILQATLETIAFEAWHRMRKISSISQSKPQQLLLAGGLSKNKLFLTLRASLETSASFNVFEVKHKDVGCFGAAMCAACAAGKFPNITIATKMWTAEYKKINGNLEFRQKLRETLKRRHGSIKLDYNFEAAS